jgi:PAS domain S-box-containing protein
MAESLKKIMVDSNDSIALLEALAENSFDSILVTEAQAEGKIIYANKAFETLTGYDPISVIGENPRILQGIGTDEKVISRLSKALTSGGNFEGKAINYKKDGTPFIMHWRVIPIKTGEKIIAWVAIQRESSSI